MLLIFWRQDLEMRHDVAAYVQQSGRAKEDEAVAADQVMICTGEEEDDVGNLIYREVQLRKADAADCCYKVRLLLQEGFGF